MLSSVLRSRRAVQVNVEIMRTFVRLRQMLAAHAGLARKLDALEKRYDAQFKAVFDAIRQLMAPPEPKRKRMVSGPINHRRDATIAPLMSPPRPRRAPARLQHEDREGQRKP